MNPFILVAALYFLVALYMGFWLGRQVTLRQWEEATCSHRWEYRSLDNLDHYWQRVCLDCTAYEKLEPEEVPYHERCKAKNYPPKGQ